MSLYGSSMAQSLGQGTFIFDKIYPNRYLLDNNKDVDGVLIGRYALVEYDRPLAVVKNLPMTYREENGTISRHYDIIKKLVLNTNNFEFANDATDQIFVCQAVSNDDNKYKYYYTAIPGNGQSSFGEWTEFGEFTPFEFNSKLDKLHATSDDNDEENEMVYSGYSGWDSTAWVKTVAENKLKYIKVADLNVLTPTFTVLPSSDTSSKPGPITTFQVDENDKVILDNNDPRQPIFNVPQYKQNENAQFNVRYPNPLDINIVFDTTKTNNNTDETEVSYGPNSKTYNVTLGKYATSIDNINGFIQNGEWPSQSNNKPSYNKDNADDIPADAGSIWQVIKETYEAVKDAENAADRAERASQQDYSQDLSVDWLLEETEKTIENNKVTKIQFAIENKPDIITSSDIQVLWNSTQ